MRDIISYRPRPSDLMDNPYLEEVISLRKRLRADGRLSPEAMLAHRREFTERYAFSVPTPDVLGMVALYSPIVEIGAGSGYWARCLSRAGADVVAYDKTPPDDALPWPWGGWEEMNPWFDAEYFPVRTGDETAAALHPGRSLLLCWPLYDHPMASRALAAYVEAGGRTLIYIGDPASSGDAGFHEERQVLTLLGRLKIWGWPGIDDWAEVRRVRAPGQPAAPGGGFCER